MSNMTDIRRENGRAAIEKAGGASKVSKIMGYSNASLLVQQFGPNPTRSPTDATMRKLEAAIGLPDRSLDADPADAASKSKHVDTDTITTVIRAVGSAMGQEHVGLHTEINEEVRAVPIYENQFHHSQATEPSPLNTLRGSRCGMSAIAHW